MAAYRAFHAIVAHVLDEALLHTLGKRHGLGTGEDIGLLDLGIDDVGGLIGHLAAIRTVSLVAVVLGGVVAGRDHDAGVAVIVAGGKGKRGHRHEMLVDADMNAIGCQNFRRSFGEHIALDTAVVADGHRLAAALGLDPVGKALGRLTNHIDVHAVGAGADDTAQARRTELEGNGKTILDCRVVFPDAFQFRFEVGIIQVGCQPSLIHFFIHM